MAKLPVFPSEVASGNITNGSARDSPWAPRARLRSVLSFSQVFRRFKWSGPLPASAYWGLSWLLALVHTSAEPQASEQVTMGAREPAPGLSNVSCHPSNVISGSCDIFQKASGKALFHGTVHALQLLAYSVRQTPLQLGRGPPQRLIKGQLIQYAT